MKTLFFTVAFYLSGYFVIKKFGGNFEDKNWEYAYYFWDKAKDFFMFFSVYNLVPYLKLDIVKLSFVKSITMVMLLVTGLRICFEVFDFIGSNDKTMVKIRMFFEYNIIAISVLICFFAIYIKKVISKEKYYTL